MRRVEVVGASRWDGQTLSIPEDVSGLILVHDTADGLDLQYMTRRGTAKPDLLSLAFGLLDSPREPR